MAQPRRRRRGSGKADQRTGFRGVPSERLRELAVSGRTTASVQDAVMPPSQEAIRAAIGAQTCPFCGAGPFKMLPVHTNKKHGVDKWELRELAGYSTRDPLCSDEALAAMRDAYDPARGNQARAAAAAKTGRRTQRWTSAGLAKNRASLIEWEAANPEAALVVRRRAARGQTPDARRRQADSLRKFYEENPDRATERSARMRDPAQRARMTAGLTAWRAKQPLPEHGSVRRYRRGCRCEPCREAKRQYRKSHDG